MSVQLRAYQPGDFAGLYALDQQCFAPHIAYAPDELEYFLRAADSYTVIAQAGGAIAGFLIAQRYRGRATFQARIITIDVAPRWRRAGVGAMLMRDCEEHMRRQSVKVLRLEVAEDNTSAHRFYQAFQFHVIGKIPDYYGKGLDALVLQKALDAAGSAIIETWRQRQHH